MCEDDYLLYNTVLEKGLLFLIVFFVERQVKKEAFVGEIVSFCKIF